jgi:DnaK suppressor protein
MKDALREEKAAADARSQSLKRNFDDLVSSSEGSPPDDEHDPEGATIGFERAQLSALLLQAEESADSAARALDRIDSGTFGTCQICGRPIPLERLTARPSSTTCVECAGS